MACARSGSHLFSQLEERGGTSQEKREVIAPLTLGCACVEKFEIIARSALCHEQTSRHVRVMSVIPLKADIQRRGLHVRLVTTADVITN